MKSEISNPNWARLRFVLVSCYVWDLLVSATAREVSQSMRAAEGWGGGEWREQKLKHGKRLGEAKPPRRGEGGVEG